MIKIERGRERESERERERESMESLRSVYVCSKCLKRKASRNERTLAREQWTREEKEGRG